jgi:putative tryptophan/tyrosine transport system substrate-binding protein
MRRREFLLGVSIAAAWPLAARAQQRERMRRIGVLTYLPTDDPNMSARLDAFQKGLKALGWTEDSNLRIDIRQYGGDMDRTSAATKEMLELSPEVIFVYGPPGVAALRHETRTIPIVFTQVSNPLGAGFVNSMDRPGGNITGFSSGELIIGGKWLQTLKETAPDVTRCAVILNPNNHAQGGYLGAIEMAGSFLGIQTTPVALRDNSDAELAAMHRAIEAFAQKTNGGMLVLPDVATISLRQEMVAVAMRHRVPAVYPFRYFTTMGGLVSYGVDQIEQSRVAAGYVDRILKGENPAELPVQAPTRYELAINLKTAKVLGLEISPTLLARADEVIE